MFYCLACSLESLHLYALSMYVIGMAAGLLTAFVSTKIENKADKSPVNQLLIELPEYKTPNAYSILVYVWENVKEYLSKGNHDISASVVLWFILRFGTIGYVEDMS